MKFFKINLFLVCFIALVFFPLFGIINAADSKTSKQGINPDSIYYPFKRIWEKINLKINFSSQKNLEYEIELLNTRYEELEYVVASKSLNEYQKASERFAYQAGVIVQKAKNIPEKMTKIGFLSLKNTVNDQRNAGKNASAQTSPTEPRIYISTKW